MVTARSMDLESIDRDFKKRDLASISESDHEIDNMLTEESKRFKKRKVGKVKLPKTVSLKNLIINGNDSDLKGKVDLVKQADATVASPIPAFLFSPRPASELDAAAIKLQKVYKSYRTRRNLADCAVVVEELWWKALDYATLRRSSVSFFDSDKSESAVSRWARARTRVARVGKGLSKDEKAQKLALIHWLEAIDPRHRYGHNLHFYYDVWFVSESSQPFFYWLDVGDGKEVNLEKCPRTDLQRQCIKYLGPKEREAYEVIVKSGKLVYRQNGVLLDTVEGSKWIFVLGTSRNLYIGEKKKGLFQHSSFLAGGATIASGRLIARNGVLEAIWPYSGHYRPTEENFMEFCSFLEEHHVDLTNVKKYPIDDDIPPKVNDDELNSKPPSDTVKSISYANIEVTDAKRHVKDTTIANDHREEYVNTIGTNVEEHVFEFGEPLSCKWSTGAGPRIGCVRDYPVQLQFQALEQVNLSPRNMPEHNFAICGPIPSPRPSPKIHLSHRLACMGIPSPRLHAASK